MIMTLDLVLRHKWYDMIASGEKQEEYRDVDTWAHRLLNWLCPEGYVKASKESFRTYLSTFPWYEPAITIKKGLVTHLFKFQPYDTVRFHRGYTSTTMEFEIDDITIGWGNPEWGAPDHEVFIIKLGKRIK